MNATIVQKPKRQQVKNACVNCQKACKKCDDGRPCKRCIKLGITATCRNSDRKERKKGIKRGPYKKKSATTPVLEQPIIENEANINYCVPSQLVLLQDFPIQYNDNPVMLLEHQLDLSGNHHAYMNEHQKPTTLSIQQYSNNLSSFDTFSEMLGSV